METFNTSGKKLGPSSDSKPGISTHKNDACENADGVVKESRKSPSAPFNCPGCFGSFKLREHFNSHLTAHSAQRSFRCAICSARFSRKDSLRRHLNNIHIKHSQYVKSTNVADQPLPFQNNKSHYGPDEGVEKTQNKDPDLTEDPKKRFSWKSSLTRHNKIHIDPAKDVEKPQKSIRKISVDNNKYVDPAEDVEEPQKKGTDPNGELKMSINSPPQRRPFECKICSSSFIKKQHLKSHLAVHSNVKLFECPQCTKRFSFRYSLNRHSKIHAKDTNKPQKSQCTQRPEDPIKKVKKVKFADVNMPFYHLSQLLPGQVGTFAKQLMVYVDNGDYAEAAKEGKEPQNKGTDLKVEVKAMASSYQTRLFECQICTNRFKTRYHLMEHMSVHSNEKPFECPQCNNRFSRKSYLNRHMKVHVDPAKNAKKPQKPRFAETKSAEKFSQAGDPTEATKEPLKSPAEEVKESQAVGITGDEFTIVEADVSKNRMKNMETCSTVGKNVGPSSDSKPRISTHKNDACENADGVGKKSTAKTVRADVVDKDFKISVDNSKYIDPAEDVEGPQKNGTNPNGVLKISINSPSQRRPFECQICSSSFIKKQNLKSHLAVHNVKLFECPQCTKRFSFRYLLNRHSKIHAKDTNKSQKSQCTQRPEDPIKKVKTVKFAEDVNMPSYHLSQLLLGQVGTFAKQLRVYVDNGDYAEAAKEGKEPQNKGTDLKVEVKAMASSFQTRPFECHICTYRFKTRHHLMYHMSVHSNEKPFECPQCNNRFSRKSTLNRHMKIHVDSAKNAKKPQKSRFTEATIAEDVNRPTYYLPQLLPRRLVIPRGSFSMYLDDSYYADTAKDVKEPQNKDTDLKEEVKP
ncbi:zinc finger protein Xfin-like [Penaeus monodon]|uniref:zinc finger protein Xfin-like n=1 Tax=Penaeus monodon TaxID=6687 RepID=UPI0018A7CAFF|nr:zinc finger protein Xfin-like [Penaeus monodon]